MTQEEARVIIRAHGWIYQERSPRGVAKYLYARRRKGLRMVERYICPLSRLEELTEEQLTAKLI
jgi:hypothetical protein